MKLSKSVTNQSDRKSCIGINFCQINHKSREIGHYYRRPCGLEAINNYHRHLNMFLQSTSGFASLFHFHFPIKKLFQYLSIFIKINMSRFTMFLYVEGQLIQYFCFECTQSKYTMYIIKIHLPRLTVCMLLESQRWGWYLNTIR